MNWTLFSAFVAATAVLILIPGPSVLLISTQAARHGTRAGLACVAGTSFAQVQQLAVTALGLTTFMALMAEGFEVLRWLGVAYLVYLGVQAWRTPPAPVAANGTGQAGASIRRMFWQGFFVSWTNPKVLAFYAAFFPQFVDPALPAGPQLWAMCAAYMAVQITLDSTYALLGARVLGAMKSLRAQRLRNRLTGGLFMAAGAGLALMRRN